jgi:hypothetical protein
VATRVRVVLGLGLIAVIGAGVVWVAGSSLSLRAGPLAAFRMISTAPVASPSPSPTAQPSPVPSPARPPVAKPQPPVTNATATCQPWQDTLTLNSFSAQAIAPGTVRVTWSASDRCPPYTGNIHAVYTGSGINGPFQHSYTITTLSGAISDKFDCSQPDHVTGATYFLGLWDSANHMIQATSSVAVC